MPTLLLFAFFLFVGRFSSWPSRARRRYGAKGPFFLLMVAALMGGREVGKLTYLSNFQRMGLQNFNPIPKRFYLCPSKKQPAKRRGKGKNVVESEGLATIRLLEYLFSAFHAGRIIVLQEIFPEASSGLGPPPEFTSGGGARWDVLKSEGYAAPHLKAFKTTLFKR